MSRILFTCLALLQYVLAQIEPINLIIKLQLVIAIAFIKSTAQPILTSLVISSTQHLVNPLSARLFL